MELGFLTTESWVFYLQKEEISRNRVKPVSTDKEVIKKEEYEISDNENELDTIKQIEEFETKLGTHDSDSD